MNATEAAQAQSWDERVEAASWKHFGPDAYDSEEEASYFHAKAQYDLWRSLRPQTDFSQDQIDQWREIMQTNAHVLPGASS